MYFTSNVEICNNNRQILLNMYKKLMQNLPYFYLQVVAKLKDVQDIG